MREVRVRVLHSPLVTPLEVQAALKAPRRFADFGVVYDHMPVDEPKALVQVRNGRRIRDLVTSSNPEVYWNGLPGEILGLFRRREIFAIGLTASRITERTDDDYTPRKKPLIGFATDNEGAVLSIFGIREYFGIARGQMMEYREHCASALALRAIEIAASHELGHIFGQGSHCGQTTCIMQENRDLKDFIERFVMTSVDFCTSCRSIINRRMNELLH
ncbi:hypothetical protein HY988_05340 [Candidatus Micrarchaeota archaeon]|nr:hypothetical protein [Candidatus Micrarchaeota archaeon]